MVEQGGDAQARVGQTDGGGDETGGPLRPDIGDLVRQHYRAVYAYAYRLAGNAQDAEDITQQTFLTAHRKLDQLREVDKADRWLFAILRSWYLKHYRQRRPAPATNVQLDIDTVSDARAPSGIGDEFDEEQLQRALALLPEDFRLALLMFYFEDLSYKEIAARLNIPMGTVMSRLSRAKDHLRRQLAASPEIGDRRGRRRADRLAVRTSPVDGSGS